VATPPKRGNKPLADSGPPSPVLSGREKNCHPGPSTVNGFEFVRFVPSPLQAHRSIGKQVVRDVTTAVASITIAFGGMTNVSVFVAAANSGEDDRQYGKTIDHVNGMTKCVKKYFRRCAPALR
jgi:hypothetical protein